MSKSLSWEIPRVAGESKVEVLIYDGSARVTYSSVASLRGFENLVIGRKVSEVPAIASRICGVCSHPHFWAASLAVEQIAGVEASEDTIRLRDVCNKLSFIQNHVIHLGVLALPDYLSREASEQLAKKSLEINTYLNKVIKLVCGRLTSPNNYSMGRFLSDVSRRVLMSALELLKSVRPHLEGFTERVLDVELPNSRDPSPRYVALSGSTKSTVPRGQPYSLNTPTGRFATTLENYRELFNELHVEYSSSKKCLFLGYPFYVGARARLLSALEYNELDGETRGVVASFEKKLKENPYSNIYAKAIESKLMFDSIVQDVSELSSRDLELQPATTRGASAGLGVVEAPRGLLIHYYEVDKDLKVVKADIATPTVMNTEHVELSATSIAKELLAEGASDSTIQKYVEALVRAYDPCIPCAVHVVKVR